MLLLGLGLLTPGRCMAENTWHDENRCAVCFSGLVRGSSADLQVDRLRKALAEPNPCCSIPAHSYKLCRKQGENAHDPTYEHYKVHEQDDWKRVLDMLDVNGMMIEGPLSADAIQNLTQYLRLLPGPSVGWHPPQIVNMIRHWNSIKRCFSMTPPEAEWVAMVRLDVRFEHPVALADNAPLAPDKDQLILPDVYNDWGYNDRFALGRRSAIRVWTSGRLDSVATDLAKLESPTALDIEKRLKLHSEFYLKWVLDLHKVRAAQLPVCNTGTVYTDWGARPNKNESTFKCGHDGVSIYNAEDFGAAAGLLK